MQSEMEDASELQVVAANMSGRFAGHEIRQLGQEVLRLILVEKNVGLFFGQQINFHPQLPPNYRYVGGTKAFLIYDKHQFRATDERAFRQKLRDLQTTGVLPYHYLPEANFTALRFRTRHRITPRPIEMIAMSWVTDECQTKSTSSSLVLATFKKLLTFAQNVSDAEGLPVLLAGTFRLPMDEACDWLLPGCRCVGYWPDTPRRHQRACNYFVTVGGDSLQLEDIRALVCANMEPDMSTDVWFNPEEAFYYDPVLARLLVPLVSPDEEVGDAESSDEEEVFDTSLMTSQTPKWIVNQKYKHLYNEEDINSNSSCYMS